MKTIYVLLSRTGTAYSRLIHRATGDVFTHAALALDAHLDEMYSFCRRYARLPWPAGFEREHLRSGVYGSHPDAPCAVYAVHLADADFERLRAGLRGRMAEKWAHGYNLLGALACGAGRMHVSAHGRMFCSEFVANALNDSGAAALKRPAAQYHPDELAALPELKCVYRGNIGQLQARIFMGCKEKIR